MAGAEDAAGRIRSGDRRSLARAITALENGDADGARALEALKREGARARVVGVTGPPGAGKSTLVGAMVQELAGRGERVAVVAVDPSSPVSGGALLGDRIRMAELHGDERVYIRSLATRGHAGGLSRATRDVVELLARAGFDTVVVESVGAGQSEVDIRAVVETCIVVCPPGLGDEVQALKAGMLEIADIYVVNKADLPGARRTERELVDMTRLRAAAPSGRRPVLRTTATRKEGIAELLDAIPARASSA